MTHYENPFKKYISEVQTSADAGDMKLMMLRLSGDFATLVCTQNGTKTEKEREKKVFGTKLEEKKVMKQKIPMSLKEELLWGNAKLSNAD